MAFMEPTTGDENDSSWMEHIFPDLRGIELTDEEKKRLSGGGCPEFGPVGSKTKLRSGSGQLQITPKSSTEGLICSWVSDFVNMDRTLVGGVDLRGMVPIYPGREPLIPTRKELPCESDPKAALHPQASRLWGWLEPESSAKVTDFRTDTQLFNQWEKPDVSISGGLSTDPWSWFPLPRSDLNATSQSFDTQSLCSSGFESGYNSEYVSPEAGFRVISSNSNVPDGNVHGFANNWKAKMDELCQPLSSSNVSCYNGENDGYYSLIQSPEAGYQQSRSNVPLRNIQPVLSNITWESKLAELCQSSSSFCVSGNQADNSQLTIPSNYQRKYEALLAAAEAELKCWKARVSATATTHDDSYSKEELMQPFQFHPWNDPVWRPTKTDLMQFEKRYEMMSHQRHQRTIRKVNPLSMSNVPAPVQIGSANMKKEAAAKAAWDFCDQQRHSGEDVQRYFLREQFDKYMLPKRETINRELIHRMHTENFIKNHGGMGMLRKSAFSPRQRAPSKFFSEFE